MAHDLRHVGGHEVRVRANGMGREVLVETTRWFFELDPAAVGTPASTR